MPDERFDTSSQRARPALALRPAEAADTDFLRRLYAATRAEELAAVPWDAAQREAFLDMQFEVRRRAYAWQSPAARQDIVLADGEPAGGMLVERSAAGLLLVDIALLPALRGRGLGSRLLRGLQAEAAGAGLPLRLHVDSGNPAARLYARLGFVITGEEGGRLAMAWRPPAPGEAPCSTA